VELSYRADDFLYQTVEALDGDLARTVVEPMLIACIGPEFYRNREGVAAKLAILRRELAPPGSSVADELLAEQADSARRPFVQQFGVWNPTPTVAHHKRHDLPQSFGPWPVAVSTSAPARGNTTAGLAASTARTATSQGAVFKRQV
jgi:hypothetical protein